MQNVRQAPKFKLFNTCLAAMLAVVLLFSCSKSSDEMPVQNPVVNNASQSSRTQIFNSVESSPLDRVLFASCANGGAGEEVALTGTISVVNQIAYKDNGFTLTYHTSLHGVKGIGLTTGEIFTASGGSQGTITGSLENGQFKSVFIEQLRIISANVTFNVRYKFNYTVTADGKVITEISEDEVDCRL